MHKKKERKEKRSGLIFSRKLPHRNWPTFGDDKK
jgi:hypothetical protein